MKSLLILGAGGHGRVCYEIAEESNQFEKIAYLDDNKEKENIVGRICEYRDFASSFSSAFIAIGDNDIRCRLFTELKEAGFHMVNLIHKSAFVSKYAVLGEGIIIGPMAVVNTSARIENAVIISAGAIVDHNAVISTGCHVDAGALVKWDRMTSACEKIEQYRKDTTKGMF